MPHHFQVSNLFIHFFLPKNRGRHMRRVMLIYFNGEKGDQP